MTPRPSWLTENCPPWCAREHREQDLSDDRYHRSEASIVPAIIVAEQGVRITNSMHGLDLVVWIGQYVGEVLDWIVIEPSEQRDPHLILSAESGALLLDQIEQQLGLSGRLTRKTHH